MDTPSTILPSSAMHKYFELLMLTQVIPAIGHDRLITSLRTAVDNDGVLDKEATSYNDIFDAFRLALKFYHFREVE